MLKKGDIYKDFYVIDVTDVIDYKCKGIYLRHRTTGLEVFHLLKDDPENLFAFCFRTPVSNSKGAPHILEHSVLCGSEKYPLKEPFITAASKSVTTFFNAMTYPDKTCYPAASQIEKQYFYLLDCYADAVFFPNLSKNTFMQEAHRYELDDQNKTSIQGVVYNEMKGSFSNFYRTVYGSMGKTMFPGTTYVYESGGDPLEIPDFTYEEYLNFHKTYYSPDNCLFYMCGNIPTEKQLDYLSENFISRLEKKYNFTGDHPNHGSELPVVRPEIRKLTKITPDYKFSGDFHFYGPKSGPDDCFAGVCSYSGSPAMEKYFLIEALCGSDSSPLTKALKESGLGDDVYCGEITEERQGFFCLGLIGVKKQDTSKVKKFINKALSDIYKKGITKDEIDATVMAIDFALREENRYNGPKALELMNKVMDSWNYGIHPADQLTPLQAFSKVKDDLKNDPDYFRHLMEKYFINENGKVFITVEPSEKHLQNRDALEKERLEKAEKNLDKEQLKKDLEILHKYQETPDSEENLKCLKRLEISELPTDLKLKTPEIKNVNGITFQKSIQPTNGIIYFSVYFPVDSITAEEFIDLPLFSDSILDLGWKGKKWDQCILEANKIAGDVTTDGLAGTTRDNHLAKDFIKQHEDQNFIGREWIYFTMKILDERIEEGIELLSDILTGINFTDKARMKTLIRECISERKSALVGGGVGFCSKRAQLSESRGSIIQELLYGVTQIKHGIEYKENDAGKMLTKFESMYKKIKDAGCLIRVIADSDSMSHTEKLIPDFIKKAELTPLKPANKIPVEELKEYILQFNKSEMDIIPADTQVGYAAKAFKNAGSITPEFAAESTLCEWINTHTFWEKLRTVHGCYGASISCDAAEKVGIMTTYRDPDPSTSFPIFEEALKETSEHNFTQDETECAVISMYSNFAMPRTPQNQGAVQCNRLLFAQTQEQVDKAMELVLKVKPEDLNAAATRICNSSSSEEMSSAKSMMCSKNSEYSGNILRLPI
ncbi:MAG: insulinase family protein [Treponema sp.]|nr:insulinase family protein [Treponema sp.]